MASLPHSEKSFWRESYPTTYLYPELTDDIEADVAVVGAGITGLTTAYLLKKAGLKVAVLEKHTVGAGTTGRTTGKVTSQHNLFYADFVKQRGKDSAKIYGDANEAAISRVESIIHDEKIECDWKRDDNYVFTGKQETVSRLRDEAEAAVGLGLPATFETTAPLPFGIKGAVKFANQAKINSQKYVLGLAASIHGDGSYIFENSNALGGISEGEPGHVKTLKAKVMAKHIIIATNVPTLPLLARGMYSVHEYPTESYLVAGHLEKELTGMYISPDEDHYSILPITVDGKPMLLVGGEGHFFGLRGNRQARFERLARYADNRFGVDKVTNRWSDRDYVSYDGVPLVGKLYPWSKRLYVGTAFKKWGLSNGTVAGMILSDLVLGNDNPWVSVFDSIRPTIVNRFKN